MAPAPICSDVDGNRYIDYLLGLGPMILGHRPPESHRRSRRAIQKRGTVFALPTTDEITLAAGSSRRCPVSSRCACATPAPRRSLRVCASREPSPAGRRSSASRACITASRTVCTGASIRGLDEAGPRSPPGRGAPGTGMQQGRGRATRSSCRGTTSTALRDAIAREGDDIAAVLTEPVMCNTGCILPEPGYLEAMRELTARARHRADLRRGHHGLPSGSRRRAGSLTASAPICRCSPKASAAASRWPRSAAGAESWRWSPTARCRWPAPTAPTASRSRPPMRRSTSSSEPGQVPGVVSRAARGSTRV